MTVIVLQKEAYGVAIRKELQVRLNTSVSVGSVQSALKRMEDKGYLSSEFGEATAKRGGKRKKIYSATPTGQAVLVQMKEIRSGLWNSMPPFQVDFH